MPPAIVVPSSNVLVYVDVTMHGSGDSFLSQKLYKLYRVRCWAPCARRSLTCRRSSRTTHGAPWKRWDTGSRQEERRLLGGSRRPFDRACTSTAGNWRLVLWLLAFPRQQPPLTPRKYTHHPQSLHASRRNWQLLLHVHRPFLSMSLRLRRVSWKQRLCYHSLTSTRESQLIFYVSMNAERVIKYSLRD